MCFGINRGGLMVKPSPKRIAKMFGVPSDDEIRKTRDIITEDEATSTKEEEWERYVTSSHRSTPDTLFSKPPERFIAKLSYGLLVYCWLLEDNREHGYLCYLCHTDTVWTTVYVYSGTSRHQRNLIDSVYNMRDVDWRVVPITNRNSAYPSMRRDGCEWSAWIFHHYFGFDPFDEPN